MMLKKTKLKKNTILFYLLFKDTFLRWLERDPFRNSTVIAYYTIFSLPGLLIIIINLTGYFFGKDAVTEKIIYQVGDLLGKDSAKGIQTIIANASTNEGFTISSVMGVATLVFGATGVFYQLQQTLNIIWEVQPQPKPTKKKVLKLIKDRAFSFGLILTVGFLLLVSLALSTALSAVSSWIALRYSESLTILFTLIELLLSLAVITLLFAAIFKFLPDAKIKWADVWIGAIVTAFLFVLAKFGLSYYFSHSSPGSAYGAAGTIVLILLWVSYAGMILFFGAEFTLVYANRYGKRIIPSDFAEKAPTSENTTQKNVGDFKSRTEIKE